MDRVREWRKKKLWKDFPEMHNALCTIRETFENRVRDIKIAKSAFQVAKRKRCNINTTTTMAMTMHLTNCSPTESYTLLMKAVKNYYKKSRWIFRLILQNYETFYRRTRQLDFNCIIWWAGLSFQNKFFSYDLYAANSIINDFHLSFLLSFCSLRTKYSAKSCKINCAKFLCRFSVDFLHLRVIHC